MTKNKKNNAIDESPEGPDDFFVRLARACGGEVLDSIGRNRNFIDTGCLAVNFIISGRFVGGGIPLGCLAEVYGENSTGKSLLGTNLLKGVQKMGGVAVYLDAERAIQRDFAVKASKVNPNELVVAYPTTVRSAFHKMTAIIHKIRENEKYNNKPIGIVYDSVTVSPTDDEFAETAVDMENASQAQKERAGVKNEQPGARARQISRELRKLMPVVEANNVSVLFVNQLRNRIGQFFGNPLAPASGEALKYYCSTRLSLTSHKKIVDEERNKKVVGMLTGFTNTKSRFCPPHQKASGVSLMFENGIDPFGGLLELLLQEGRLEGSNGNYTVADRWADGQEVKFKASKERNTVPVEVMLKCPALVDATSPGEIQYYVDLYSTAMGAAFDFSQEDLHPDEDN